MTAISQVVSNDHLASTVRAARQEAEQSLIGAVMVDNAQLQAVGFVSPEHFGAFAHQVIWRQVLALHDRGCAIDYVTLRDALASAGFIEEVGPSYLFGLTDGVPRAANAEHYGRVVVQHAHARNLVALCRRAAERFEQDPAALGNGAGPQFADAVAATVDRAHGPSGEQQQCITVMTEEDLNDIREQPWVIADLLPEGVTGLVAQPGVGKTTAAVAMAVAIASGHGQWLGRPVPQRSPVLLVVGEGASMVPARIRAAKLAQGLDPDRPIGLSVVPHTVNFFEAGREYRQLRSTIAGTGQVVIVDTLGLNTVGADENAAADMTRSLLNMRQLGARAVVFLHHLGVNGGRERGSSAIRANCDALLALVDVDDHVTLSCEKMRDAAAFEAIRLKLQPVDQTHACSIGPVTSAQAPAPLSPAQRQALEALVGAFPSTGSGATRREWAALVPTLKERTFYHAVSRLVLVGLVTEHQGRFSPVHGGQPR